MGRKRVVVPFVGEVDPRWEGQVAHTRFPMIPPLGKVGHEMRRQRRLALGEDRAPYFPPQHRTTSREVIAQVRADVRCRRRRRLYGNLAAVSAAARRAARHTVSAWA